LETALGVLQHLDGCGCVALHRMRHAHGHRTGLCHTSACVTKYIRWLLSIRPAITMRLGYTDEGPLFMAASLANMAYSCMLHQMSSHSNSFMKSIDALKVGLHCYGLRSLHPLTMQNGLWAKAVFLTEAMKCAIHASNPNANHGSFEALKAILIEQLYTTNDIFQITEGLGWCLISFLVALHATVADAITVMDFLLPRHSAELVPVDGLNIRPLLGKDANRICHSLLIEALCSCLIHGQRSVGVLTRTAAKGTSLPATEQSISTSCLGLLLPTLATYRSTSDSSALVSGASVGDEIKRAVYACIDGAGLPLFVQEQCRERLDLEIDIYL
jgi:hypothetical protein